MSVFYSYTSYSNIFNFHSISISIIFLYRPSSSSTSSVQGSSGTQAVSERKDIFQFSQIFSCQFYQYYLFVFFFINSFFFLPVYPETTRPLLSFPSHLLKDFQVKLDAGQRLHPVEQKLLIHSLANHLNANTDFTRTTCARFSKMLTNKYPAAVEIRDADNILLNNGYASFLTRLYERLNTIKPKEMKRKRNRLSVLDEDEDEDGNLGRRWSYEVHEKYDSYGCVAWEPALPDGEDDVSQEEKKLKMATLEDYEDEIEITTLMQATFATQRRAINRRKGEVQSVIEEWPYLMKRSHFLAHANTLLGKDVKKEWEEGLATKGLALFDLIKSKVLNKKLSGATKVFFESSGKYLLEADAAALNLRCDSPRVIAVFPAVINYFKEESFYAFKIVEVS